MVIPTIKLQRPDGTVVEAIGRVYRMPNGARWPIIQDPNPARLLTPADIGMVQLNMVNAFRSVNG